MRHARTTAPPRSAVTVSRERFEAVRRRFAAEVRRGEDADLWSELLRLQADEAPVGERGAWGTDVPADPDELCRIVWSAAALAPPDLLTGRPERVAPIASAIAGHRAGLDGADRPAFAVLFERIFRPLEALRTVPLAELFPPAERAAIEAAPAADTPIGSAEPFDVARGYDGYVCAIVKFTRHCNLRCTYCHDWDADPDQRIPVAELTRLFASLLGSDRHRIVDVVWHGGEPTLLGRAGFRRILRLQQHFRRPGQTIRNMIQTNGTAVDDAWARLLRRTGVKVGVSIDGPRALHDRRRPDARGRPTFDRVRRGIRALKAQQVLGGVILVVSREMAALGGAAIVRFLREEGLANACALPVRPGPDDEHCREHYLEPAEFSRFLLEIEDARTREPGPIVRVRELDAAINALRRGKVGFCELQGDCHGAFYAVDGDGSVMHCDKFLGDERFVLGNVRRDSFDAIRDSERLRELAAADARALDRYRACPHFAACRGWCPHERHVLQNVLRRPAGDCCGLSPLFDGLLARGLGGG